MDARTYFVFIRLDHFRLVGNDGGAPFLRRIDHRRGMLLCLVECIYHEGHDRLMDTKCSHQVWMLEEHLVISKLPVGQKRNK